MCSVDTWRWIHSAPTDGATQMAMDQAILENGAALRIPTMRVYQWKPYCISLGYHQSVEVIDLMRCQRDGIDVVRRPTGGRAVFHAEEVTYSVVIPKGDVRCSWSIGKVYNLLSQGLARGIRMLDVPAELQKRAVDLHAHYQTPLSASCFSAAARHEVMVGGRKLVGSAQRRLSEGLLQHGSVLTGDAHLNLSKYLQGLAPEEKKKMQKTMESKTVSLSRYLERKVNPGEVIDVLRKGMEEELGMTFVDGELTEEEKKKVHLLKERFSVCSSECAPLPS